ncbi:MAG: hypothetical protein HZB45_12610 [Mycolicibacterium rufum]|nr:hypothetical protein [Mycolicibacterium rufum]
MGSRARTTAAACLVAGGVWAGATGTPTAYADPADSGGATDAGATGGVDGRADAPERGTGAGAQPDAEPAAPAAEDPDHEAAPAPDIAATDEDPTVSDAKVRRPCRDGGKDCGPGWPWPWPWPDDDPDPPGAPNPSSAGGGSDRPVGVPRPGGPPRLGSGPVGTRPPVEVPFDPDVIDTIPGVGLPAAGTGAPISAPLLTVPVAAGTGGAATPAAVGGGAPAAPRRVVAEPPPARQPPPAPEAPPGAPATPSGRIGYGEALRTAGTSQLAALALPGVVGIVVLTALGGLLGYRQAKAGQALRARGTARFMN